MFALVTFWVSSFPMISAVRSFPLVFLPALLALTAPRSATAQAYIPDFRPAIGESLQPVAVCLGHPPSAFLSSTEGC